MAQSLKQFLVENQKSGYYVEHGPAFEMASIATHEQRLRDNGYSSVSKHSDRRGVGFWFHSDLEPLTFDQHVDRLAAAA